MRKHEKIPGNGLAENGSYSPNICVSGDLCSVHCHYEFAVKCSLLSPKLMRTKHCRRNCEEMWRDVLQVGNQLLTKLCVGNSNYSWHCHRKSFRKLHRNYAKRGWIWDVPCSCWDMGKHVLSEFKREAEIAGVQANDEFDTPGTSGRIPQIMQIRSKIKNVKTIKTNEKQSTTHIVNDSDTSTIMASQKSWKNNTITVSPRSFITTSIRSHLIALPSHSDLYPTSGQIRWKRMRFQAIHRTWRTLAK